MNVHPDEWPDAPRGHRSQSLVEKKHALIDAPHVKPLNDWVRELNASRSAQSDPESVAPWFDPAGGGVNARVLLMLEAPGSRSAASRGSGIISIDNNDATAANLFTLTREAGLRRDLFANWNIVPWYLPAGATRTKTTQMADVLEATGHLETLIERFADLRLVVTMGNPARDGWQLLRARSPRIRDLAWEAVPHPSAQNLNTRPHFRAGIRSALEKAALV